MTVRLYKIPTGLADVSSSLWNRTTSLLSANIIRLALDQSATDDNLQNIWLEYLADETNLDTKDGSFISGGRAWFYKNIDAFDDASINTAIWTAAGSTVEATGAIGYAATARSGSATWISNGASGFDFKALTGDSEIYLKVGMTAESNTGGDDTWSNVAVQISNGATHIDVYELDAASGTSQSLSYSGEIIIYIDKNNEDAYVSTDDGVTWSSPIDISSVTTNWYLRGTFSIANGGASGTNVNVSHYWYDCGYLNVAATGGQTATLTMDAFTAEASNDTVVIATQGDNGTIQPSFSMDGGSNYTDANEGELAKSSITGSTVKVKFTATLPSTAMALGNKPHAPWIKKYGVLFG